MSGQPNNNAALRTGCSPGMEIVGSWRRTGKSPSISILLSIQGSDMVLTGFGTAGEHDGLVTALLQTFFHGLDKSRLTATQTSVVITVIVVSENSEEQERCS